MCYICTNFLRFLSMKHQALILLFFISIAMAAQVRLSRVAPLVRTLNKPDTLTAIADTTPQAAAISGVDIAVYNTAIHYTQRLDSLIFAYRRWHYEGSDTLSNPFYAPLFATTSLSQPTLQRTIGSLPPVYGIHDAQVQRVAAMDRALLSVYSTHPELVRPEVPDVAPTTPAAPVVARPAAPTVRITPTKTLPAVEPVDLVRPDFNLQIHRPNFWKFTSDLSLQFMQNYISDNWYKGGESNNSMLANVILEANYNNKRKLTFSNRLEMKLGFYSSKSDSIHRYKTNNDQIRLTNKLDLKASKHWSYTAMLQTWTQFYRGYRSNDRVVYSDFMSPFESVLSLGMTYKLSAKSFTLEATFSPLAADYKFVGRRRLATSFGIDEGHHTNLDYGSSATINTTWTPIKNVTWKARLYAFTDYSRTTIEWENTINFKVNDFLSTQLFLYPRFDDGVVRQDNHSYLQFKEYLSLSFNYKF